MARGFLHANKGLIEWLIEWLIWKAFNGVVITCTWGAWELAYAFVNIKPAMVMSDGWRQPNKPDILSQKIFFNRTASFNILGYYFFIFFSILLPSMNLCAYFLFQVRGPWMIRSPRMKWPSCRRGLCLSTLYPFSFSSVVRESNVTVKLSLQQPRPFQVQSMSRPCSWETNLDLTDAGHTA